MPFCPNCLNEVAQAPAPFAPCQHCFYPGQIFNPHVYAPPPMFTQPYAYYGPPQFVAQPQFMPQPQFVLQPQMYPQPAPTYPDAFPVQRGPDRAPTASKFSQCPLCGGSDKLGAEHVCFPDLPSPLRLNNGELDSLIGEHEKYIARYKDDRYGPTQHKVRLAQSKVDELKAELVLRNRIKTTAKEKKAHFSRFPLPTDFDIAGARYLAYVMQLLTGQVKPPKGMPKPPRLPMPESLTVAVGSSANEIGLHYALSGEQDGSKIAMLQPEIQALCGMVYVQFYSINTAYDLEQSFGKAASYDPDNYSIRVCAEPKLWDRLGKKEKQRYNGMTTLWVGSKANPYPLIPEETGVGSPMLPCPRCRSFAENKL